MASVGFLLHRELAHLQFYGQKSLLKAHSSAQQHKWEHQWVHSIHTRCSPRDWAMSQFWGWKAKIKCQHRLRWKQQVMVRGVSRIRSISVWAVCWFHLFRLPFFLVHIWGADELWESDRRVGDFFPPAGWAGFIICVLAWVLKVEVEHFHLKQKFYSLTWIRAQFWH